MVVSWEGREKGGGCWRKETATWAEAGAYRKVFSFEMTPRARWPKTSRNWNVK